MAAAWTRALGCWAVVVVVVEWVAVPKALQLSALKLRQAVTVRRVRVQARAVRQTRVPRRMRVRQTRAPRRMRGQQVRAVQKASALRSVAGPLVLARLRVQELRALAPVRVAALARPQAWA